MAEEEVKEEITEEVEEKKKGVFGKVKDAILPDPEEQAAIIPQWSELLFLPGAVGY